jgi:hypothetical protein
VGYKTLPTIIMLEHQLGAISLLEAIEMLRDLDCGDDHILRPCKSGNKMLTVYEILNYWHGEFPAAGIKPIIFCGGSPGQSQWYTGSLLTMVIDRILYKVSIERVNREPNLAAI